MGRWKLFPMAATPPKATAEVEDEDAASVVLCGKVPSDGAGAYGVGTSSLSFNRANISASFAVCGVAVGRPAPGAFSMRILTFPTGFSN